MGSDDHYGLAMTQTDVDEQVEKTAEVCNEPVECESAPVPMDEETAAEKDAEGQEEAAMSPARSRILVAVGVGVFLRLLMYHLVEGAYRVDKNDFKGSDTQKESNAAYLAGTVIAMVGMMIGLGLFPIKLSVPLLGSVGLSAVGWLILFISLAVFEAERRDYLGKEENRNYHGLLAAGNLFLVTFHFFSFAAASVGVSQEKSMAGIAAALATLGTFMYSLLHVLAADGLYHDEMKNYQTSPEGRDGVDVRLAGGILMFLTSLVALGAAGASIANKTMGRVAACASTLTIAGFLIATVGYGLMKETAFEKATDTDRYLIVAQPLTAFFMLITTVVACLAASW